MQTAAGHVPLGIRLPCGNMRARSGATGATDWATDRWGPPVGFVSLLPRARQQREERAPVRIAGARGLHFPRSTHQGDREKWPPPLDGERITGKLGLERGITHGGGGLGLRMGFSYGGSRRKLGRGVDSLQSRRFTGKVTAREGRGELRIWSRRRRPNSGRRRGIAAGG